MPNSPWTETGSSISLVPSTTTIGSDPENVNYLSNQDKINLMAQYTAELAMKTSLDTLASTWSVSSTFYDNAVAAISTALINAGAPSNWATSWPDGTTSGPWPGIQTSLANLWAQVATQRTALQSVISSAQAAAAQAAAISTAAANAASMYATTINAPAVVSSLPTLPNASYPIGKMVVNSSDGKLYTNAANVWTALKVAAGDISGTLAAAQIASLAASQVTGQLTAAQIASIGAAQLTGQITGTQISNGAISTPQLAAGAVTAATIAANTITASQIAAGAITATQIAAGTVTAANIAAGTIQASNIAAATITGDKIAANAITSAQIAAGTITASDIAANTITAGQIAAGAIGATQIAANSILASNLVVSSQGSNMVADPLGTDIGSWLGGGTPVVLSGLSDVPVGNTAVANQVGASSNVLVTSLIPIDQAKDYLLSLVAKQTSGTTGTAYFSLGWYDATGAFLGSDTAQPSGAGNPAGWVNGSYSYYGLINGVVPTTWTPYSITFGPNSTAAIPSNARFVRLGGLLNYNSSAGQVAISNVKLVERANGSLIVDGSITASKIAAGAISASMITTGTLNAANVAVTNLNASNITAGTLSASKVLFTDGTALTTASRVVTSIARESSTATATGVVEVAIPGLTFSVTAASTADVYNFFGSMSGAQTAGTVGTDCYVNIYVDGAYNQGALITYPTIGGTVSNSFVMILTGLSAGAHTIQLYMNPSLSTATFQFYPGSSVICQRIY